MERFLLFIADGTKDEYVDLHPNELSAHNALIGYVRQGETGQLRHISDEDTIAAYFTAGPSFYKIARVSLIREAGNDQ